MSLAEGVALFNQGRFWEAHEAWETAWIPDRHGPDRGFYKGLIQIAAGCLHCRRANRWGARNKWQSGTRLLDPYLPTHHELELGLLAGEVGSLLAQIDEESWPQGVVFPQIKIKKKEAGR
jgi:uncharacterized protein